VASFVFMAALLWHAWVGVRNILMDYVKPAGPRLALEGLVVVVLVGYLGWTIAVLWGGA
jgi:succinate dehydrogenase / fumarate reductase membrane anchor subunit